MKSSKAEIQAKVHKIPELKFSAERKLTSYAGIIIFQALFARLSLVAKLRDCFAHLARQGIYGPTKIILLLIVHLLLGFRRLRGLDYYRTDPLVARVVGLSQLPDVATLSRTLASYDDTCVANLQQLNRELVMDRLRKQRPRRITVDFDGSVQSTKGHAEGTAVGFNKKKKGARSYYPLFATVAQVDQIFDLLHRPGNVHDSNGATTFIAATLTRLREALAPGGLLECRIDSAFYQDVVLWVLETLDAEFTCSVPFERLPALKAIIEQRQRWRRIDDEWSYFETQWKPKCWQDQHRLICLRRRRKVSIKGPLQLDLFVPRDFVYEYKVIATNKTVSPKAALLFHNGRGAQEKIFGEGKQNAALDYIPTRRKLGNQVFTLAGILAHNLSRELQMATSEPQRGTTPKRRSRWTFASLGTIRQHLLHTAGALTRPQGKLTLTMNANKTVRAEMSRYLDALQQSA